MGLKIGFFELILRKKKLYNLFVIQFLLIISTRGAFCAHSKENQKLNQEISLIISFCNSSLSDNSVNRLFQYFWKIFHFFELFGCFFLNKNLLIVLNVSFLKETWSTGVLHPLYFADVRFLLNSKAKRDKGMMLHFQNKLKNFSHI